MKAQEYLSQIAKIDIMIENKSMELRRWRGIAENAVSNITGERVQTTANPHRMEDAIVSMIDIEPEVRAAISELKRRRKEIIKDIERLPADEYNVLHKVYVLQMDLKKVAPACDGKSYSWATTVHGRGLRNIQRMIDERDAQFTDTKKSRGAKTK